MNATAPQSVRDPMTAVIRTLHAGIPKLVLFGGTDYELVLRAARVGDIIEDPECDVDFTALKNGIFHRVEVSHMGLPIRLHWMFLCSIDDLPDVIARHTAGITEVEIAAIGIDAAWQSFQ